MTVRVTTAEDPDDGAKTFEVEQRTTRAPRARTHPSGPATSRQPRNPEGRFPLRRVYNVAP